MKLLFTICGRAGSKGIKNKNISNFCGIPLSYYSLSVIDLYIRSHAETIDYDVVLSTDSPELISIVGRNPFFKVDVINRCEELSGDNVGKIDVIRDCMFKMQERKNCTYDLVVDLDITSPLRTKDDVENLIETAIKTKADVTFSVTDCRRNPYFNQVMKSEKGYKKVIDSDFTARQQAPDIFDMNASLYAYKPTYLLDNNGLFGGYIEIIKMYDTGVLDLDHPQDFDLMQVIAEYLFARRDDYAEVKDNILREKV